LTFLKLLIIVHFVEGNPLWLPNLVASNLCGVSHDVGQPQGIAPTKWQKKLENHMVIFQLL